MTMEKLRMTGRESTNACCNLERPCKAADYNRLGHRRQTARQGRKCQVSTPCRAPHCGQNLICVGHWGRIRSIC